jgi:hypothetical protein
LGLGKVQGNPLKAIFMTSKTTKQLVRAIVISGLIMSSCKKEGCTDKEAVNYQASAKVDNGSCTYSGSVILWYKVGVFTGLASYGVTNLSLYIDDELQGEYPVGFYSPSEPTCGTTNTMSLELNLGSEKSKEFNYEIIDQNGTVRWSGILDLSASQCSSYELML